MRTHRCGGFSFQTDQTIVLQAHNNIGKMRRISEFLGFVLMLAALSLHTMLLWAKPTVFLALLPSHYHRFSAARQPYDVRKIIDAFRNHHDDLKILCAHRGLR